MVDRRCALFAVGLILLTTAAATAQFPVNPDFEGGADGWALPDRCEITRDGLALSGGWAISAPAEQPVEGWQRVAVRVKGPGAKADSRLLLALLREGEEPLAQASVPAADAGSGRHTVSAELLAPADGAVSVAVGVEGEGAWLIDSVTVEAAELTADEEADDDPTAVIPELLEPDWEPEGLLDAIERPIARGAELLVNVGALEVGLPPRVTAKRGHRGTVRLIVSNRATTERALTVSVTGPPGFYVPERTVTVQADGDTTFKASLQAFFVGMRWAKITFRTGDEEASAPIEVEVTPSYPAPGVTAGGDARDVIGMLQTLGIPLIAAPLGPDLPDDLTRLRLLPPPWSEQTVAEAAAAADRADFVALHHARGESPEGDGLAATRALGTALEAAKAPVYALGPPADLQPGPPPSITDSDLAVAGELGAAGSIAAPTMRLPVLEARPARAVLVDRRQVSTPQPSWTALSRALDIHHIPSAIRKTARLPMFFADLAARATGSAECDAMLLARTLVVCAWQGATGWTIPADAQIAPDGAAAFTLLDADGHPDGPVAQAYAELSRELSAAVPLAILKQSADVGLALDAAVGFRPFIRNDEGILALWNNTGARVDLIFEVRTQPLDMHTVSVSPAGVRRSYTGSWHFSDEAIRLNRPVAFVTLQPAELKVLSMQLARPHMGWLSSVEREPKIPRRNNEPKSFFDDRKERNGY